MAGGASPPAPCRGPATHLAIAPAGTFLNFWARPAPLPWLRAPLHPSWRPKVVSQHRLTRANLLVARIPGIDLCRDRGSFHDLLKLIASLNGHRSPILQKNIADRPAKNCASGWLAIRWWEALLHPPIEGADLLADGDQDRFWEMKGSPGFSGFAAATGFKCACLVLQHCNWRIDLPLPVPMVSPCVAASSQPIY
jgi:hypothetical protein